MGVQIIAHSKLRAVINPPLLLATVAPAPGSQLLRFRAGRVEKKKKKDPVIRSVGIRVVGTPQSGFRERACAQFGAHSA